MKTTLLFLLLLRIYRTSAHKRASVKVTPSWSQHFEYEKVSVSCEQFGSGQWTVWRYAKHTSGSKLVLSHCESGWGSKIGSTCEMKTIKLTDSGVYWCQSKHGDSSNAVNITVTGRKVILQSLVHPVMKGDDATLRCEKKNSSNLPAEFLKNGSPIGKGLTGQMIIRNFSHSDEGAYKCRIGSDESPSSWLLMKGDSDPALLTVSPNSAQLFEYKNLILSCGDNSSFHGWKTIRATTRKTDDKLTVDMLSICGEEWGTATPSGCELVTVKQPDSGIYWCESPAKQRSNSVNITVHDKKVILWIPPLPVMEGDNVTLHCKTDHLSNLPAAFYKDGSLIRTEPAGHMTIHHVSKSDEGLYKCHISSHGESPPSWLFVRGPDDMAPSTTDPAMLSLLGVFRHLVVFCPYCISTVLMVSLYFHRSTGRNPPVSMTTFPRGGDDEGLDQPYDDVIVDVTTEHNF